MEISFDSSPFASSRAREFERISLASRASVASCLEAATVDESLERCMRSVLNRQGKSKAVINIVTC